MIQFIAIYLLCLRDTYLKRMFTGRQVTNNSLLRHHIATRTPIGTGQIRRSQRFFNLFCRIPLITYICGNSWYQPYSRGRIKTAERSTVITPRNEIQHLLAINRHDVPFLHKLISATYVLRDLLQYTSNEHSWQLSAYQNPSPHLCVRKYPDKSVRYNTPYSSKASHGAPASRRK